MMLFGVLTGRQSRRHPGVYPGAPQDFSNLPSVSNSSTAGAAMQQSVRGGLLTHRSHRA